MVDFISRENKQEQIVSPNWYYNLCQEGSLDEYGLLPHCQA